MRTKEFELLEENAVDSPVKDIKWYGKEDKTDEKLMHDQGVGELVDIKLEEWKLKPEYVENPPTSEQILTPEYIKTLQVKLWADGLRLVMQPRISIDNGWLRIFAPCKAVNGQTFLDQPKTIQEWTK